MSKRIIFGVSLLGLLFFFISFLTFSGSYRMMGPDADSHHALVRQALQASMKALQDVKTPDVYDKLTANGNLEAFNQAYDAYEAKLIQHKKKHVDVIPLVDKAVVTAGMIAGMFCFVAGGFLIFRCRRASFFTYGGCFFLSLYYIFIWMSVYPSLAISRYMIVRGRVLSLLIDPGVEPVFDGLGDFTIGQVLLGFPFVIFHLFVLTVVGGSLYILSRPQVKEYLGK